MQALRVPLLLLAAASKSVCLLCVPSCQQACHSHHVTFTLYATLRFTGSNCALLDRCSGHGRQRSEIQTQQACTPLALHCAKTIPCCMQVATLYNLCKALQSFHSRGMVHCSLSPPDFSWYQGGQGWKVASCGDWAQQGMHVRSCYALRYASPEVCSCLAPACL